MFFPCGIRASQNRESERIKIQADACCEMSPAGGVLVFTLCIGIKLSDLGTSAYVFNLHLHTEIT